MGMLQLDLKLLHGDSSGVLVGFHLLDAEHALFFLLIEDLLRLLLLLRVSPLILLPHGVQLLVDLCVPVFELLRGHVVLLNQSLVVHQVLLDLLKLHHY